MGESFNSGDNDRDFMNDLIPYRCPKCGDTKKFATLRNLKTHLEYDHSFKIGCVTPRSRNTVFSYKSTKCNHNSGKRHSKILDEASMQSFNSRRSSSDIDSGKSPLLESFKKDAQLLETQLIEAKEAEMRNKLRRNVTKPDQGIADFNLRDTINALNNEITQSRQSQWGTADTLYQTDRIMHNMEEAAEQKCQNQQSVIQDLVLNLKSKEGQLEHANESVNMLRKEREKLMHDMEYLFQHNGEDSNKLKMELEEKNNLLSSIHQQLQGQKMKASQILNQKDEELKSAQSQLNQLQLERQKLIQESDNMIRGSTKDQSTLKQILATKEKQLKHISRDMEKLREEQHELLDESIQLYKTASTGNQKMKLVMQSKDNQLEQAYDELRNIKQAHEQLIWESQKLTQQSDTHSTTLKKMLETKEEMLNVAQNELEKLTQERNQLLQNIKGVNMDAINKEQTLENLKVLVKQKERQLVEKESETTVLKDFLNETAQKEAVARKKLEKFISDLIDRADKAETELKLIKSQLDSRTQTENPETTSLESLYLPTLPQSDYKSQSDGESYSSLPSGNQSNKEFQSGSQTNVKHSSNDHSQKRPQFGSQSENKVPVLSKKYESSDEDESESIIHSMDSSSHPLKTRDSGVASITQMKNSSKARENTQTKEPVTPERKKKIVGPVCTSTPMPEATRRQKAVNSPRASTVAKKVIEATIEPWHQALPSSVILPPVGFADEKFEIDSSSSNLSDLDLSLSVSSYVPVSPLDTRNRQIDHTLPTVPSKMEGGTEPIKIPRKSSRSAKYSASTEKKNALQMRPLGDQLKSKSEIKIKQRNHDIKRIQSPDSTQYSPLPKPMLNKAQSHIKTDSHPRKDDYLKNSQQRPSQSVMSNQNHGFCEPRTRSYHSADSNKDDRGRSVSHSPLQRTPRSSNIYKPTPFAVMQHSQPSQMQNSVKKQEHEREYSGDFKTGHGKEMSEVDENQMYADRIHSPSLSIEDIDKDSDSQISGMLNESCTRRNKNIPNTNQQRSEMPSRTPVSLPADVTFSGKNSRSNQQLHSSLRTDKQHISMSAIDNSNLPQISEDSYKVLPKEIPYAMASATPDVVYIPVDRKTGKLAHRHRPANQNADNGIVGEIDSKHRYLVDADICTPGVERQHDPREEKQVQSAESDGGSVCLDDFDDEDDDNTLSHVKSISEYVQLEEEEYSEESFEKCMDDDGIIWDKMETVESDQSEMDSQRVSPYGSEMKSLSKPVQPQTGHGHSYVCLNTNKNENRSESGTSSLGNQSKNVRFDNNYIFHQTTSDPIQSRKYGSSQRFAYKEKRDAGILTSPEPSSLESRPSQRSNSSETSKSTGRLPNIRNSMFTVKPQKSTSMFELSNIGNDINTQPHDFRYGSSLQNLTDLDSYFYPGSKPLTRDSSTQTWLLDKRLKSEDLENIHHLSSMVPSNHKVNRNNDITCQRSREHLPRSTSLNLYLDKDNTDSIVRISTSLNGNENAIDINLFQKENKSLVTKASVSHAAHDLCKSDSDIIISRRKLKYHQADHFDGEEDNMAALKAKYTSTRSTENSIHSQKSLDQIDKTKPSSESHGKSEDRNRATTLHKNERYSYIDGDHRPGSLENDISLAESHKTANMEGNMERSCLVRGSPTKSSASMSQKTESPKSRSSRESSQDERVSHKQKMLFDHTLSDKTIPETSCKVEKNGEDLSRADPKNLKSRSQVWEHEEECGVTNSEHSISSENCSGKSLERSIIKDRTEVEREHGLDSSFDLNDIHYSSSSSERSRCEQNVKEQSGVSKVDLEKYRTESPLEFSHLDSIQNTLKQHSTEELSRLGDKKDEIGSPKTDSVHSSPSKDVHKEKSVENDKFSDKKETVMKCENVSVHSGLTGYNSSENIAKTEDETSYSEENKLKLVDTGADPVEQYLRNLAVDAEDTVFADVQETDDELTSSIDDFRGRLSTVSSQDIPLDKPLSRREERRRRRCVLHSVFQFLDVKSLVRIAAVCREWKHISRHPSLWKQVYICGEKCSSQFLFRISNWCTSLEVLTLKDLKSRDKYDGETEEEYVNRSSLEPGLERLLQVSESTLTSLSIINCGYMFTDKSIWLASCYSRLLKSVSYVTNVYPLGADVMYALGAGCRDITSLIIPPLSHCNQEEKFNNKCLQIISQFCQVLEVLSVGGSQIDLNGLVLIAKSCPRLNSMAIHYSPLLDNDTAVAICRMGWKNLRCLSFIHTPVSPEAVQQFYSNCKHLKSIEISLAISDYCSETTKQEDIQNFGEIVQQMKDLEAIPGLSNVLKLNMQTD